MRVHRFIGNFDLGNRKVRISDPVFINQIRNVLRLKRGDFVSLSDSNLNEAQAKILKIDRKFVEVEIVDFLNKDKIVKREISLYASILKKENFELIVQKATEVGVSDIFPIVSRRTIKLKLNETRLLKIAREAAEQCGRTSVPVIHSPLHFAEALKNSELCNKKLFFDPSGTILNLKILTEAESVAVFIGPEGGWEKSEISEAKNSGFLLVGLGGLVFKAETAAIIASYLASLKQSDTIQLHE